jgi:hypothetical protein
MNRLSLLAAVAMTIGLVASVAHSEQRGREGGRQGGGGAERGSRPPGGEWSQRSHGGGQFQSQHSESGGTESEPSGRTKQASGEHSAAAGAAASNRKSPQASGEEGAAAGAAAANRKSPQASGAQGAAAGAAAANRKSPQATGAQGAAAGAAAASRNSPQATGAQGAAAGAAAANRKSPQATGAQGAAAGAAVANRNSPQVSGAEGAAAGAAAANRNSPEFSGADGAAAGYASVRNSFDHPNVYGQQWYGDHPGAWAASGWASGAAWVPSTWEAIAGQCGYGTAVPTSYNYGVNVNAQDGNVTVDGENVGTTAEFSQQAADLAQTGTAAETTDSETWLPLGVFAMVRNESQHPHLTVQLAINKDGILRGNYTDEVTDNALPIHGAVDKTTKRAAWTVGGNTQTVMEAGLDDLTHSEASALIHRNGKTDHWLLVRLEQPQPAAGADAAK